MSKPTIYLHGFSGEGASLEPFAKEFSGKEYICINMPGFGGTSVPEALNHDIRQYSEEVWRVIRRKVPKGPVKLVGHSHGTMVAFVLALTHADEVERLDLFCPVAAPRLIPRLLIKSINIARRLLGSHLVIRILAWQPLVDVVTRYSLRREWTAETRRRIIDMRRRESQHYSPIIFDLMDQTEHFMRLFNDAKCTVPTGICFATDDNVSRKSDHDWYRARTGAARVKGITGGHLCVVAEPKRVVRLYGRAD